MKKIGLAIGMLALIANSACIHSVSPDAGTQAVLVRKPYFFGSGGIAETPINPGLKWVAWSTSAVYVNIQPRQHEFNFDDLFTMDGVPLDFHAAVQYQITDSVKLTKEFGADDSEHGMGFFVRNLEQPFRMIVRDAVKKHGLNEMAINVSAADSVDQEVTARFSEVIAKSGVPIKLLSVTLGRANPPDAIKHQRIATAEQEQRQKTEQQAKLAEDQRKAHEESRAAADNAYREAMHLSPEQFLQLKNIEMLANVCSGGKCTFINGHATPVLNVR